MMVTLNSRHNGPRRAGFPKGRALSRKEITGVQERKLAELLYCPAGASSLTVSMLQTVAGGGLGPRLSGQLMKRAVSGKNRWAERFFVVRDNFLFYFKTADPDCAVAGVYRVDNCTIKAMPGLTKGVLLARKEVRHTFQVRTDMREKPLVLAPLPKTPAGQFRSDQDLLNERLHWMESLHMAGRSLFKPGMDKNVLVGDTSALAARRGRTETLDSEGYSTPRGDED